AGCTHGTARTVLCGRRPGRERVCGAGGQPRSRHRDCRLRPATNRRGPCFAIPYRTLSTQHQCLQRRERPAGTESTDEHSAFVERATEYEVLGVRLPVASVEDVLQGKVWAAPDESGRPSKRQKDLADIARLLEVRPDL